MLTVLGGLAEFERELILARTSDGRARAKAKGVKFGRPPALTAHQRQEAIQRLQEGATQADLARSLNVSPEDKSNMPGQLVASGKAELALHQLQELMAITGLDILGEFPGELRGAFMFTAALVAGSNQEAPAKLLVDFLGKPYAVEAIRANGMSPAN
jgi:hypothetical protein